MKNWEFQKLPMSPNIEILEGAFVVSDAHYSHLRPQFLDFLQEIENKKLQPTQLILMGDIFDTLFGGVSYTLKVHEKAISIINKISENIEVVYLEGNHDFNLQKIFPKVKLFSLKQQPVACGFQGKKVYLAHGDIQTDLAYRIYADIIRNRVVIFCLNFINKMTNNLIIDKLDTYLSKKDDCKHFSGFKEFISRRLVGKYQCDYFLEGHYHQNRGFDFKNFRYINLGAFACNQRYFIVKSSKEAELLEENIFSKGT